MNPISWNVIIAYEQEKSRRHRKAPHSNKEDAALKGDKTPFDAASFS